MGTFGENKMKGEMFNCLIISKIKTNKWTKTYAGPHKIKKTSTKEIVILTKWKTPNLKNIFTNSNYRKLIFTIYRDLTKLISKHQTIQFKNGVHI